MYHGNKGCNRGFGKSSLSQQSPFRAIAFLTPSTVYFALYVDGIGTIDLFSTASLSYNKLHVCAIIRHCCIRSVRSCRRAIQEGTELSAACVSDSRGDMANPWHLSLAKRHLPIRAVSRFIA